MRKIVLIMPFLLVLLMPVANATANFTCQDTNTLLKEIEIAHYINGSLSSTEIWNQTVDCVNGCSEGKCLNENINFGFPLIFTLVGFSLGYFSFKINKTYYLLHFLFLGIALSMFLVAVSITNRYMVSVGTTTTLIDVALRGYTATMWLSIAVASYFMIVLLKNVLLRFKGLIDEKG